MQDFHACKYMYSILDMYFLLLSKKTSQLSSVHSAARDGSFRLICTELGKDCFKPSL